MEDKPTFASVTETPCTCHYLQESADDPSNPIVFDKLAHEFQIECRDTRGRSQGILVIYHCPFCGGAAPKSKRDLLFHKISVFEESRLSELLKPIETISDALQVFGVPDLDDYERSSQPEDGNTPPLTNFFRVIRYFGLSDVAVVCLSERSDGRVFWQLQGKPIEQIRGHSE